MADEPQPTTEDYQLHDRMQLIAELMEECGITRKVLSDGTGISPSALTNKFNATLAIVSFEQPKTRDRFTPENEKAIVTWFHQLADKVAAFKATLPTPCPPTSPS